MDDYIMNHEQWKNARAKCADVITSLNLLCSSPFYVPRAALSNEALYLSSEQCRVIKDAIWCIMGIQTALDCMPSVCPEDEPQFAAWYRGYEAAQNDILAKLNSHMETP